MMHGNTNIYIGTGHPVPFFRPVALFFFIIFLCNLFAVSAHAAVTLLSPGKNVDETTVTIPIPVNAFPNDPEAKTEGVTVFRWTHLNNSEVESYVVQLSATGSFTGEETSLPPVTRNQGLLLTMTGADLRPLRLLPINPINNDKWFAWRVIARNGNGDQIDQSGPPYFVAYYNLDQRGFTVLSGVVQSDANQAALVGAAVTITSTVNSNTTNRSTTIGADRNFILVAETTDNNQQKITTDISLQATQVGFNPALVSLDPTSNLSAILLTLTAIDDTGVVITPGSGVDVVPLIQLLLLKK